MKYKIALGLEMGTVDNRLLEWDKITQRLSRHSVSVTKGGRYFVGGEFVDHRRQETSLLCRSMLTIDIDELPDGIDITALEIDLVLSVPYAFVAYSTFSHTPDKPRIRRQTFHQVQNPQCCWLRRKTSLDYPLPHCHRVLR
jgi:hypothetical protein